MSEEKNNGLFGENEPIDLGSDASFPELPDFPDSDFDSIFGTAENIINNRSARHVLPAAVVWFSAQPPTILRKGSFRFGKL